MGIPPKNIRNAREPSRVKGFVFSDFQERVNQVKVIYKSSLKGATFELDVWYWPSKFDDDMARVISSTNRTEDNDAADMLNEILRTVVKEWDIWDKPEEQGGRRVPPEEIVTDLEIVLKSAIVNAIQDDLRPGEAKRQQSVGS